jgi:hypothetical protein
MLVSIAETMWEKLCYVFYSSTRQLGANLAMTVVADVIVNKRLNRKWVQCIYLSKYLNHRLSIYLFRPSDLL